MAGRNAVVDFFYGFWSSLEHPTKAKIKPQNLVKFLDRAAILDVTYPDDNLALTVRLIGTFVAGYYGEIAGQDIRIIPNKQASDRIYKFSEIMLQEKVPIMTVTPAFAPDKDYLEATALYLPFYGETGDIERILVGVDMAPLIKL